MQVVHLTRKSKNHNWESEAKEEGKSVSHTWQASERETTPTALIPLHA